jgi:predicted  nucleic acid-binding Zn-ribbon protein
MSKLRQLEQKIKDKIQQAKNDMHPTHNKAYFDSLNIEIETLNWALNEILVLSRT